MNLEKYTIAEEGILSKLKDAGKAAYKKLEDYDRWKNRDFYAKQAAAQKAEDERRERERREEEERNKRTNVYEYSNKNVFNEAYKQANFSMTVPSKFKDKMDIDDNEFWDFLAKDTINAVKKFINTKAYTDEIKRIVEYHNSHKEGDIPYDESLPDKISVNWWKSQFKSFDFRKKYGDYIVTICTGTQNFNSRYGIDVSYAIGDYIEEKYGFAVTYGDEDEGCIYFD